jgi:Laminin G domain
MRTRSLALLSGLAVLAAALQWGAPAAATNHTAAAQRAAYTATVIGDWQMDETSGQVMTDTSGNGLDGYIGTSVVKGWSTGDGGTAYHFAGPLSVQNRERLATVDETDALDPGTDTYSVIVRFRTLGSRPNILQKGQSEDTGGYWKLVIHTGWPRCHYRDLNYNTKAIGLYKSPDPNALVNDGDWHTLRCERNASSVCVYLDEGTPTAMKKCIQGSIGSINNKWPLSIGGKYRCNPLKASTTCDYFNGDIDWVRIERPAIPFGVASARAGNPIPNAAPRVTAPTRR